MNRMDEAVILFDEICNSTYFEKTSMILFLNKEDLLISKLKEIPFKIESGPNARFTDFEGTNLKDGQVPSESEFNQIYESTKKYIEKLFKNRNKQKKEIFIHWTCATNTDNIEVVFNCAKDIILQKNLEVLGFISGQK